MATERTSFFDRIAGRIDQLDAEGLQTVVARLARERDFLETLFDTIEDGVLVLDGKAHISWHNQSAEHLLSLPLDKAEGQGLAKFLPGLDWDKLCAEESTDSLSVTRHELEVAYPIRRFLRVYTAALVGEGAHGLAVIINDATEQQQKTFEVIESERVEALTLLAASVAHEIGNPLNALHIHLQLMEREVKKLKATDADVPLDLADPDAAANHAASIRKLETYLEIAKGEINRLDYIISQFLQAIRPTRPELKPVSLNDILLDTLTLLGPEIENRDVTLSQNFAEDLPNAPLDQVQVKQALVNLIKNAIQAMTQGGALTLTTIAETDGVWVYVADTGGGIPQEKINRIFQPYFTTKKEGSGLGLMIVQRIVREHGGRIELESNTGQGTTFRLWFPLTEQQPLRLTGGETSQASETNDHA
jgi:signal transduction histidine kinase|tara:strand:- start:174 stop:1430 length:1257 start_codon:yes stop_codon:yes gene_type:complete